MPNRGLATSLSSWEVISEQQNVLPDEWMSVFVYLGALVQTEWCMLNMLILGVGFRLCNFILTSVGAGDKGLSHRLSTISSWLNILKYFGLKAQVVFFFSLQQWLYVHYDTSFRGEVSTVFRTALRASINEKLMLGSLLDPDLCTSPLGWF